MNCFGYTEKTCRHCKRTLPVEQFAVRKNLSCLCADCRNSDPIIGRFTSTPSRRPPRTKTCHICRQLFPIETFVADGRIKHSCSDCRQEARNRSRSYQREYHHRDYATVRGSARSLTARAIRNGTLVNPGKCFHCGSEGRVEAHHPDYEKPLDVIWLCKPCHRILHPRLSWAEQRKLILDTAA